MIKITFGLTLLLRLQIPCVKLVTILGIKLANFPKEAITLRAYLGFSEEGAKSSSGFLAGVWGRQSPVATYKFFDFLSINI